MVSDLVDYLNNNLLIAHYCGFDISHPLPSYWTFDRFLINFDNDILSDIMQSQVRFLLHLMYLRLFTIIYQPTPNLPTLTGPLFS